MSGQIERLSNANSVMYVVRKLKIPLDYAVKVCILYLFFPNLTNISSVSI